MTPEIIRTSNFVADAAGFILEQARVALAERGEFRIALSGGNTPRPIYAEFARLSRDLPWEQVRFTFGDERCVPPDDEQSNFRMARESLFATRRRPGKIDPADARRDRSGARGAGIRGRARAPRDAAGRNDLPARSDAARDGRRRAHRLAFSRHGRASTSRCGGWWRISSRSSTPGA